TLAESGSGGKSMRVIAVLAAAFGFLGVAIGAFGAHGLADPHARELIEIGARYQMYHALAGFAVVALMHAGVRRARWAAAFFYAGILLFSGSLYARAFGAPGALGMLIPMGGTLFLIGWGVLTCAAFGLRANSN